MNDAAVDNRLLTRPFALLVVAHFLQALGYSSLILLPVYLNHLGADRTGVGVVMAAAALGGIVVRPVVAWSLDRVGRKPTLLTGTALLAGGLFAIGLVDRMGAFVVGVHGLIGVGEAALFTGYFTFAADLVPERRRTEGLALFGISGLVPLVINPIAGQLGVEGPDFRWFFPIVGLLVASSALALWPLQETAPGTVRAPLALRDALLALRHRALWPVWLATVVFAGLVALFMSFVTVIAVDRGASHPGAIWLTYAFGAVTVRLVGASLPDRIGPSRMVPPALLFYVAAIGVAAMGHSDGAFVTAGLLAGVGHGYCFPVLAGQTVTRTPPSLRGSALSLFTALWDLAKLALVPLAGVLADATTDTVMLLTAGALALAGLAGWMALEAGVPDVGAARAAR